ncbi:hypothetical protein K402DRAFT_215927 [Aulographum hederae CBS 113979]|uniref:MARVEL domain-containing protein n=1 Tax=Aulographum hederae CBS 113979 TaxID=1176131 RepID=A0A6G1GMJ2_9PEZI|nr:hypothetical protein K402DRAFT_215927 [Aulographum hederae CBS 113979]
MSALRDRLSRHKTAPTHYPFLLFHGLRSAQLLSSVVVGSIMCYFIYHLKAGRWPLPWTFIVLLTVSLLTLLFLSLTIILHLCTGLNPRLNIVLNLSSGCLWTLGFALLTWWSSTTLSHVCNLENWHDGTGVMVCRTYKVLFAFALLGWVSTLAALTLDFIVWRRATRLGRYGRMGEPLVAGGRDVKRGGFQDLPGEEAQGEELGHYPGGFTDQGTDEFGLDKNERIPRAARGEARNAKGGEGGYEVPEGQFGYDDTEYRGAHGR